MAVSLIRSAGPVAFVGPGATLGVGRLGLTVNAVVAVHLPPTAICRAIGQGRHAWVAIPIHPHPGVRRVRGVGGGVVEVAQAVVGVGRGAVALATANGARRVQGLGKVLRLVQMDEAVGGCIDGGIVGGVADKGWHSAVVMGGDGGRRAQSVDSSPRLPWCLGCVPALAEVNTVGGAGGKECGWAGWLQ